VTVFGEEGQIPLAQVVFFTPDRSAGFRPRRRAGSAGQVDATAAVWRIGDLGPDRLDRGPGQGSRQPCLDRGPHSRFGRAVFTPTQPVSPIGAHHLAAPRSRVEFAFGAGRAAAAPGSGLSTRSSARCWGSGRFTPAACQRSTIGQKTLVSSATPLRPGFWGQRIWCGHAARPAGPCCTARGENQRRCGFGSDWMAKTLRRIAPDRGHGPPPWHGGRPGADSR